MVIAVIIGVMWNSNYQEIASIRDQHNLQLSLEDCKRLFGEGIERNNCFEKSFQVFGTNEQMKQWEQGYYSP